MCDKPVEATTRVERLKSRARELKAEILALSIAYRDPQLPWYSKVFLICVVGYALSPVDLIPDFIPVLGYLDDLILIPLGVSIALKIIPEPVMQCAREEAALRLTSKGGNWVAGGIIIGIWVLIIGIIVFKVVRI